VSTLPPLNLGDITIEQFLADYWQQRPLLIRQALPSFQCPVAPDELAGLALDEEVESRIIIEKGGTKPWQIEHGPFAEARFGELPESHWTLLIQEINKHVPELALLQERFNFIPNWRLDDVMASYAPEFGTVGPHADNYDVFLIQGLGQRRWQINRTSPTDEDLIPGLDLRIMHEFTAEDEWVLEPGDMLYLPPGIAHHGVALDNCITLSVGFRAPAVTDIISHYLAERLSELDPEQFYSDPRMPLQKNPGEITQTAREQIRAIIHSLPQDDATIDEWFGHFTTDIRPGHHLPKPEQAISRGSLHAALAAGETLWRSEFCRFAYIENDQGTTLFIAGESYRLDSGLAFAAPLLCGQRFYNSDTLQPHLDDSTFIELLTTLYNEGCLYLPDDE